MTMNVTRICFLQRVRYGCIIVCVGHKYANISLFTVCASDGLNILFLISFIQAFNVRLNNTQQVKRTVYL